MDTDEEKDWNHSLIVSEIFKIFSAKTLRKIDTDITIEYE